MSSAAFIKEKENSTRTQLDNLFITGHMPDAPELAVKAYIYGLMLANSPGCAEDDICAVLKCTAEDLRAAFSYWAAAGIVSIISDDPLKVRYLDVKGVASVCGSDPAKYAEFIAKVQGVLGTRVLSGAELAKVYDWIEVFGFEQEAAVEIIRHCLDKKGARTSISYMDAVARTLASSSELTLDAVNEHFRREELLTSGAANILRRWNKRTAPTEDQIALYEKWTKAWGFDDQSIDAALVQMTAAEKPSFAYLDGILDEWRKKGCISHEKIIEMQRRSDLEAELARQAFQRAGIKRRPSSEDRRIIGEWNSERGMSAELILYAAERSKLEAKPFAAMKRIIEEIGAEGISSVGAARQFLESPGYASKNKRSGGKNSRALNYIKGISYSDEELKKLGISMGEEFYNDDDE